MAIPFLDRIKTLALALPFKLVRTDQARFHRKDAPISPASISTHHSRRIATSGSPSSERIKNSVCEPHRDYRSERDECAKERVAKRCGERREIKDCVSSRYRSAGCLSRVSPTRTSHRTYCARHVSVGVGLEVWDDSPEELQAREVCAPRLFKRVWTRMLDDGMPRALASLPTPPPM